MIDSHTKLTQVPPVVTRYDNANPAGKRLHVLLKQFDSGTDRGPQGRDNATPKRKRLHLLRKQVKSGTTRGPQGRNNATPKRKRLHLLRKQLDSGVTRGDKVRQRQPRRKTPTPTTKTSSIRYRPLSQGKDNANPKEKKLSGENKGPILT